MKGAPRTAARRLTLRRRAAATRFALLAGALMLVFLWPERASAQQEAFYLDRIQISGAPDDGFVLWRPYMAEKTRLYGAAALGYTLNPLRASTVTDDPAVERRLENPVRHQLILHPTIGVELNSRFLFGLALPIMLFQEGGADPQREDVGFGLERRPVAIHDLRLDGRVKLIESSNKKFRLGAGASFWLPTGDAFSFAGDLAATSFFYGTTEYDFGSFLLAGQLGPHIRPDSGIHNLNGDLDVSSELRYGVGVFVPLRSGDLRLGGTLWGTLGIESGEEDESTFLNGNNTDFEWLAEVRTTLDKEKKVYFMGGGGTRLSPGYGAPDLRLLAMIGTWTTLGDAEPTYNYYGPRRKAPRVSMRDKDTDEDGYPDDIDLCPTEKEDGKPPDASDGCPKLQDKDGDGIPDREDKCPDDPEDKDGIQDRDGCPEKDADEDGILDKQDKCPTRPGVAQPREPAKHGCPKGTRILESDSGIQLLEPIQFEFGKSTIKAVSFPILDEVVDVLKSRPEVRMGIYGHTDIVGSKETNMRLSRERAAAVVDYLVDKGINRKRLESEGFGPDRPVATNDTAEGRAKNRRVEFKVIE